MRNVLSMVGGLLAIVVIIVGFLHWAGRPPYANEEDMRERIAGVELQYREQKSDNLDRRIFEPEAEKIKYKQKGEKWPDVFERELRRLIRERERNQEKIKKLTK